MAKQKSIDDLTKHLESLAFQMPALGIDDDVVSAPTDLLPDQSELIAQFEEKVAQQWEECRLRARRSISSLVGIYFPDEVIESNKSLKDKFEEDIETLAELLMRSNSVDDGAKMLRMDMDVNANLSPRGVEVFSTVNKMATDITILKEKHMAALVKSYKEISEMLTDRYRLQSLKEIPPDEEPAQKKETKIVDHIARTKQIQAETSKEYILEMKPRNPMLKSKPTSTVSRETPNVLSDNDIVEIEEIVNEYFDS